MDVRAEIDTRHVTGGPADELAPDDFLFIGELAKKTGADPKTIQRMFHSTAPSAGRVMWASDIGERF